MSYSLILMSFFRKFNLTLLFCFLSISTINAQESSLQDFFPHIIINKSNNPSPGYFFLGSPTTQFAQSTMSYVAMVDNYGTIVYYRNIFTPSYQFSLNSEKITAFISGDPAQLYFMNEHFKIFDSITTQGYDLDNHGYAIADNGNIILLGKDNRTVDMSQIVEGGRESATVIDLIIQEFTSDKQLLYTWNSKDHFNILDTNEESNYIHLTSSVIDYVHVNSVIIDTDTSMLISCRHMDEITKIDRRTGEIIYRLGGKNNEFTFINDPIGFSHQHSIQKLDNGNLLFFDNGNLHEHKVSTGVEYQIDEAHRTATLITRIEKNPETYIDFYGSIQRVQNGNTIIGWGYDTPSMTEFLPDGTVALEIDFSEHSHSPSIIKYEWKNPWFSPVKDTLEFPIWEESANNIEEINIENTTDSSILITGYSNHTNFFSVETSFPIELGAKSTTSINILFNPKNAITGFLTDILTLYSDSESQRLACQVSLIGKKEDYASPTVAIFPNSFGADVNSEIVISFSESIRLLDNTELNYQNVDNTITIQKSDYLGEIVANNANVNTEKNTITIIPNSSLEDNQLYYVSFGDIFEDYSNNIVIGISQTFNTGSLTESTSIRSGKNEIIISPNPSNGKFQLLLAQESDYKVVIMDMHSKIVSEDEISMAKQLSFDLSLYPSGIYLVLIYSNGELLDKRKIVKD